MREISINSLIYVMKASDGKSALKKKINNRAVRSQYRLNLDISKANQVSFGNKSIMSLGPKIWNCLSSHKVLRKFGNIQKSNKKLG